MSTVPPIPAGYDALRHGAAWLDLSGRGKIKASGEDRARLLHAMTTNHIQQLAPGEGCYAYFLSAQGRILSDVNILCRPEYFLLDTEPETREKVFKHLDSFIIADDVTLEDDTPKLATIALEGPLAQAVVSQLGGAAPEQEYGSVGWEGGLLVRTSYTGGPGYFLMVPRDEREAWLDRLARTGAVAADAEAFRIVRIENGRPRYGEDISERYLAQEANQPRAMHFNKGCYLGQEIVERVRSRGQIHRVLAALRIEGVEAPEPGTKLQAGTAIAGEITSAAFSPAMEQTVALAYVRVDHAQPGGELFIADRRIRVISAT